MTSAYHLISSDITSLLFPNGMNVGTPQTEISAFCSVIDLSTEYHDWSMVDIKKKKKIMFFFSDEKTPKMTDGSNNNLRFYCQMTFPKERSHSHFHYLSPPSLLYTIAVFLPK